MRITTPRRLRECFPTVSFSFPPQYAPSSIPSNSLPETGQPEIGTGAVRVVGGSLLAAKEVDWLTAFRAVRRRVVLYLVAAPGLLPLNLPENEELRGLAAFC